MEILYIASYDLLVYGWIVPACPLVLAVKSSCVYRGEKMAGTPAVDIRQLPVQRTLWPPCPKQWFRPYLFDCPLTRCAEGGLTQSRCRTIFWRPVVVAVRNTGTTAVSSCCPRNARKQIEPDVHRYAQQLDHHHISSTHI